VASAGDGAELEMQPMEACPPVLGAVTELIRSARATARATMARIGCDREGEDATTFRLGFSGWRRFGIAVAGAHPFRKGNDGEGEEVPAWVTAGRGTR